MKRLLSVVCLVLALPGVSSAALIQHDALAAGDGLITRDSATGLDWLDVTFTTSRSFNSLQVALSSDPFLSGFRRATGAEVHQLLVDAGFVSFGIFDPGNVAAAQLLTGLLGDTYAVFPGTLRHGSIGMLADQVAGALPIMTASFFTDAFAGLTGYGLSPDGAASADVAFLHIGHYLVRNEAPPVVAEPTTLLLVGTGLALSARRRRQRTRRE